MKKSRKAVSPRGAAEHLGLQTITILRWIKKGRISAYRLPNGRLRILVEDIDRLLKKDS